MMRFFRAAPWACGVISVVALLVSCGPRTGSPAAGPAAANPQSVADFYRGKTVTIIVGLAPGGGYDTAARLVAKYLGKYLPGNPNVIVENMEGAGSILAANNVYNVAKPDGLTLGVFNEQMVTNQLIGAEGVQFDARKYGWVGNAQKVNPACTIRADSPYKTAEDLGRKDLPPLIFGATGPGSDTYDFAKLVIVTTGANARVVSGYSGTATIRLAVDGREADGLCWAWDSVLSTAKNWLDSGAINVPIYQAPEADPKIEQLFPTARRLEDLTNDEDTKRLIRASTAASRIAKPFVAPPGVPAERLAALQEAFIAATKDPDLQTDAEQARFEINPNTGEQAAQIVNEILSLPPELTKRLADIRK